MARGTLLDGGSLKTTKKSTATSSSNGKTKSSLTKSSSTSTTKQQQQPSSSSSLTKNSSAAAKNKRSIPASSNSNKKAKKEVVHHDDDDEDGIIHIDAQGKERRRLKINDPKWNQWHKQVLKESLEGMDLLHSEGQSKVETILKLFDLDVEYGPAAGMTRLERWERASKWGLNPPREVYEILMTIEGGQDPKYRDSLYNGMV